MNLSPFIEHVRRRPSMYVGPTNVHAIYELIDQVCRAVLATSPHHSCTALHVFVDATQTIDVQATGYPRMFTHVRDADALTQLLTQPETPPWDGATALALANALSSHFQIALETDTLRVSQTFRAGQHVRLPHQNLLPPHAGVRLRFIPDDTIISGWDEYQSTVVGQRLALLAVLTKVPITYTDHQLTAPIHYHYPDGMRNLLVEHLGPQRAMNGMMLYCAQQAPTMHAEVAVHWGETTGLGAWSVVNGYVPADGGTHIRGVWHGLIEGLDQYVRAQGWFSAHAPRLRIAHLPQTLTACIAVQADTIHYGNATKMHVDDPLVRSFLRRVVRTHVVSQFAQQPSIIRAWFEHVDTHNPANT